MQGSPVTVVWLKRDLRSRDHAPLRAAQAAGRPVVLLYCWEPSLLEAPQHSPRHWRFVYESLQDLTARGWSVVQTRGEVVEVLTRIAEQYPIEALYSHQETGHRLSFVRDRAVRAWTRANGVPWTEYVQDAVIRGRKHRRGFEQHVWDFLKQPVADADRARLTFVEAEAVDLPAPNLPDAYTQYRAPFQRGGESYAHRYLESFTAGRGRNYARHLGRPVESRKSCSRLSPYLAWGCLSARQAYAWTNRPDLPRRLHAEIERFRERLWWRSHYAQKLEAEWQIEHEPINRALRGLDRRYDEATFTAWAGGRTGFPMLDAAMRCLAATGWINFRLRAMLVTFASFGLWLPYRPVAQHLGRLFLDYDPGIHYAQIQMQAGLTGYHLPRHFNPYLQGEQFDPDGTFVHRWVPELAHVPAPWCHYPHRLTAMERQLYHLSDSVYPPPLFDYDTTIRQHQDRYWQLRNAPETQALLPAIWEKFCLPQDIERYVAQRRQRLARTKDGTTSETQ